MSNENKKRYEQFIKIFNKGENILAYRAPKVVKVEICPLVLATINKFLKEFD